MDWLRRARPPEDSRLIAAEAVQAEEQKRWAAAEELYRRALSAGEREGDEFNLRTSKAAWPMRYCGRSAQRKQS